MLREEAAMIARVWRGKTRDEKADEYGKFLKETAYPDYGGVTGNCGWVLLRRPSEDGVEFVLVSLWDSIDALRRYAGGDPERPKYYAEDRAALVELPEKVEHNEVVDAQLAGAKLSA
jgi:heme-degrading monooxygenase HmoA